jgi:hypothetical protein
LSQRAPNELAFTIESEGIPVAGFHMPFPGLGYVEKMAGTYRWVPHGYQLNL